MENSEKHSPHEPQIIDNESQSRDFPIPLRERHLRKVLEADDWKAVGSPRRASYAAPMSAGYFDELAAQESPFTPSLSPTINDPETLKRSPSTPPGFAQVQDGSSSILRRQSSSPMQRQISESSTATLTDLPIFHFFGGRSHGTRSFSFNHGAPPHELLPQISPADVGEYLEEPAITPYYARKDSSPLRHQSPLEDPIFGPNSGGTQNWDANTVQKQGQNRWKKALTPDSLMHRRVSTFSNQVKQPWANNSEIFLKSTYASPASSMRRASTAAIFGSSLAPPPDSHELADRYFSKDPSLLERRHSDASALAHMNDLTSNITKLDIQEELPKDFATQYGNLIDNSTVLASPLTSSIIDDENRLRSWSDPPKVSPNLITPSTSSPPPQTASSNNDASVYSANGDSKLTPTAMKYGPLYIVEFKGGRNDIFFLPREVAIDVKLNDLVIVEADRGKDLGKVVMANIQNLHDLDGLPGAHDLINSTIQPKAIYRHAQGAEVSMLLDKARDESKALSICVAKARQKGLPMEVVDAEYQWDRKKLTFYFVSESRIDFRELVKDLFKIYKTRIWMCAVERQRGGIKIFNGQQGHALE